MMGFEVLGPVRVTAGSRVVALGPPQQQKLLALLLVSPNETVSTDRLVEEMWPEDSPRSARHLIHVYVSRLRHLLAEAGNGARIVRSGSGYSLMAEAREVDAQILEMGIREARDLRRVNPVAARRRLIEVTTSWRGRPFGELSFESASLSAEAARLEELYVDATGERIALDLEIGNHHQVVEQLERLTAEYPYRESFWEHLMLALYRCDRQAEALQACQRLREMLGEELGLEPGPEVTRLEDRVLAHDPALSWEPPPPPSNVPARLTSFVGRSEEIAAVTKLLDASRLVTLTGPGGVGKTSLAIAVVERERPRFSGGVWWTDLRPATDPEMVVASIAATLGVSVGPGIPLIDSVATSLVHREVLLIVDNCEHVVAAVGDALATVLRRANRAKVLATSRVPLHISGESLWTVPPLELPAPDAADITDAAVSDAVRLLVSRGSEVDPRFELTADNVDSVVDICRRLDGLPLAIEMAAARLRVLSVTQAAASLRERFDLLTFPHRSRDPRHQTLAATLDWSYDQLSADLQHVLDRLSVLAADFDLDSVPAIADLEPSAHSALEVIESLVDASMITVADTVARTARYRLLETTREYCHAHLTASGQYDAAREAHAGYFLGLVTRAGQGIGSPGFAVWTTRITGFYEDFRLALAWSLDHHPRARTLEVAPASYHYWLRTGNAREAGHWGRRMIEGGAEDVPSTLLAPAHLATGFSETILGDPQSALTHIEAAIDLYRRAGDRRNLAHALWGRGNLALRIGDFATVRAACQEALAICDEIDDRWGRAGPLSLQGLAEFLDGGSLNEAERLVSEALTLYRELGDIGSQVVMNPLAAIALRRGDLDAADRLAAETATIAAGTGWEATALVNLAEVRLAREDVPGATAMLERALTRALDTGLENWFRMALRDLARVALVEHEPLRAARLMGGSRRNMPHYGLDPAIYEAIEAGCTDLIDDETFNREVEAGSLMNHDELLRFATAPLGADHGRTG